MPELAGKTYWLIGASEGLGKALAEALSAKGAKLVLSARSAEKLEALAARLPDARALPCDVAQEMPNPGPVDGIIYCAGSYEPMAAEDWDTANATQMAEINFTGALRALGQTVPRFAQRGAGHIVLIGSLAGFFGLPGAIGYGASKAALMHLAENLRADLKGRNVIVQRINPGFIETRLTEKNKFKMPQIMTPEAAAAHVVAAMERGRFSTSFPAPFAWVFTLGRFLPRPLRDLMMG